MATPRKTSKPPAATNGPAMTPAGQGAPAASAPAASGIASRSEIKGSGTAKAPASPAPRAITHQMIEQRAYEIYAGRGYAPGDPTADWLEAERQLKAGL